MSGGVNNSKLNLKDIISVPKKIQDIEKGRKCSITIDDYLSDIELHIPSFTIHRKQENINPTNDKDYEWNIPILVKDIHQIKLSANFGEISSVFGVRFKTVMIYGLSTPVGVRSKNDVRLYSVDDGTGSIIVHYPHTGRKQNMDILTSISRLRYEMNIGKKNGIPLLECYDLKEMSKGCSELFKSMDVIMRKIKKQTYFPDTFFKHGVKVSVVGVPYKILRTGETHLYAHEMIEDGSQSKDKELFFKTNLIRYYRNNFLNNL